MSRRRYRGRDLDQFIEDKMEEMRARGIDARDFKSLHPEGPQAAMEEMFKDISHTKDQSQAWVEHGKETMKERVSDAEETRQRREDEQKRGEY